MLVDYGKAGSHDEGARFAASFTSLALTVPKCRCAEVLRRLYGREAPWMNVLSIGDSTVERTAITEVMWSSQYEVGGYRCTCHPVVPLLLLNESQHGTHILM